MINNLELLVCVQVDINRAVCEGNKPWEKGGEEPRPEYVMMCVNSAINHLRDYKKKMGRKIKKKAVTVCLILAIIQIGCSKKNLPVPPAPVPCVCQPSAAPVTVTPGTFKLSH